MKNAHSVLAPVFALALAALPAAMNAQQTAPTLAPATGNTHQPTQPANTAQLQPADNTNQSAQQTPSNPAIVDQLTAGSNTIRITGAPSSYVSVYSFDSSFDSQALTNSTTGPKICGTMTNTCQCAITSQSDSVVQSRHLVNLAQAGTSGSGPQTSVQLQSTSGSSSGPVIYTITLAQPLAAGTTICLAETPSTSSTISGGGNATGENAPLYTANLLTVVDAGIYGRFQAIFTGGAIISNQIQSGNSTSAAPYLDGAFSLDMMRPQRSKEHFAPGIVGFANGQLSAVPVSANSTTTTTGSSTTTSASTSVLTQSLNSLSSQNSVRVYMGLYATVLATKWFQGVDRLTIGPIGGAGFETLLNPTSSSQAGGSTSNGTPASVTTDNFSQLYDFWSSGLRVAWEEFRPATDYAARTDAYLTIATGDYSNLPSYVCKPKIAAGSFNSQPTWTSCVIPVATTAPTTYEVDASRHLVPRIEATAFLRVPNTSIVVGMDANLGQYSFGPIVNKVDPLSKPGNDVRIYIGYQLNLTSALGKLGVQ